MAAFLSVLLPVVALLRLAAAAEHIVIIDSTHPAPQDIDQILSKIDLDSDHKNVSNVFNNSAFSGFAATIQAVHIECLQNMSDVLIVEESVKIAHAGVIKRDAPARTTRGDTTWGLNRISSAFFSASNANAMDYTYVFDGDSPGGGSDIYMLDTGIWTKHHGFDGRASMIYSFDGNNTDPDGHGTHTAGTAGAIDFGVASAANIFGLRVLDSQGHGTTGTVIAGLDQVVRQHDQRKQNPGFVGSVASMSLATNVEVAALDQAITAVVKSGIHIVVAAGNSGTDACNSSPAAAGGNNGNAITVGAVDISNKHTSFSNYGSCVDVYAPGQDVLSAGLHNPDLLVMMTGTSQATPHVTGLVAYAMALNKTLAKDPALMKHWIQSAALPLGDGTSVANNGANADTSHGMIGAEGVVSNARSNYIASKRDTAKQRNLPSCRQTV